MFEYQEKSYSAWGVVVFTALLIGYIWHKDAERAKQPVANRLDALATAVEPGKIYKLQNSGDFASIESPHLNFSRPGVPLRHFMRDEKILRLKKGERVRVLADERCLLDVHKDGTLVIPYRRVRSIDHPAKPAFWIIESDLIEGFDR